MGVADGMDLSFFYPVEALNGGLFVSLGDGIHPTRTLDTFELLFVARGILGIQEAGRCFYVSENQSLLLWPGRSHSGISPYPTDLSFYWVHFRLLPTSRVNANTSIHLNQLTDIVRPERMIELFRMFLEDQESEPPQRLAASHNVMLMLCELAYSAANYCSERDNESVLSESVLAFIASHYHEQISTSLIAEHFNYNPDYLERVFRSQTRSSITAAIHARRVREARARLMLEGERNINEIAFVCGFSDPGYFRRVFKRRMNMTPKEFRALYRRTHINTY